MSEKQESTPNLFDYLEPPLTSGQGTIYDYEASLGESVGAHFGYVMDVNPIQYGLRQSDYWGAEFGVSLGLDKLVPADVARKEISDAKLEIPIPDRGITRLELDTLKYMKRREQAQLLTMGRRSGPVTSVAGFGAGVAASFFDPANAALAFIPVVPEVRYAQWVAEAGSLAQRSAIRAAVGALEGGAGALVLEPYVYYSAQLEHREYTAADSFMNVAFGTALGGGLHVLGGGAFDYFNAETMRSPRSLDAGLEGFKQWRDAAANAPDSVHMDALHTMARALEEDMPEDVGPVFGLRENAPQPVGDRRDAPASARDVGELVTVKTENQIANEYLQYTGGDAPQARLHLAREREAYTATEFRDALDALYSLDPPPDRLTVRQISVEAGDGVNYFDVADEKGNLAYIQARLSPDGKTLIIDNVESVGGANSFGGARFREVARQLVELMPGVQQVEGRRVSGARRKAPAVVRQDLSGLIDQSRADRTQAAFDRQFVDDEPTIRAAEKAAAESADEFKPEDIAADTEMFTAHLESMRARELVTPEMEGMIRAGDEAAAKLEAEAAAWEAAAVCEAGL